MTRLFTQRLAQLITAGALVAFAGSLALHHPDPSTAAESGFLTWVIGITLGALALSRHSAASVVPGGLLLALALCLPAAEGTRGALVLLLLVSTVAVTTWRVVQRREQPASIDWIALALAWQCLLRSERLIEWQLSIQVLVWLVALPVAAALAAWWYGRSRGAIDAVVLLAATLLVSPGLGVVPVAVLIVVAALCGERGRSWQAGLVAAAAAAAAYAWQPTAGPAIVILIAALALRHIKLGTWLPWIAALAWTAATVVTDGAALSAFGWMLICLPVVLFAPASARPLALTALALALSHRPDTPSAGLAPPFALAALTLPPHDTGGLGSLARGFQKHWSLVALAWVALRDAYPWLREPLVASPVGPALTQLVATFGLWLLILGIALAVVGAGAAGRLTSHRWLGVLLLIAFLACAGGRQPQRLNDDTVLLTSATRRWVAVPDEPVQSITIDGFLNRSESVANGRPAIHLQVKGANDRRRHEFVLRNGTHIADWAARRLETIAPPVWISWFAGDGSLAQRYRVTYQLPEAMRVEQVKLVRSPSLPPETQVAVVRVEAR